MKIQCTEFRILTVMLLLPLLLPLLPACTPQAEKPVVVIYVSVDQVYAEPILKRFEEQTGIRVLAVYDVEASKTTGLVNRLIAEQGQPQADVFWSGEFVQTLLLQQEGVLTPYASPESTSLPDHLVDPNHYWTAFGGRARVILINTDRILLSEAPRGLADFLDPRWQPERIGLANPLFVTTCTHAAALYAIQGPAVARQFFADLAGRGVRILDGNSVVRDMVAAGQLDFGLTDTDDACGALANGAPVAIIYPDQDSTGTLVIPNTVALIAGGPHPQEGRLLIDYLLSPGVEAALISSGWFQIPTRTEATAPAVGTGCLDSLPQRMITVPLADIYHQLEAAKSDLTEIYLR